MSMIQRVRTAVISRVGARLRSGLKGVVKRMLLAGKFRSCSFRFRSATGSEIPVLMCLWNRPGRIEAVLRQLDRQNFPGGVDLYLWNNNRQEHQLYLDALGSFSATGALTSVSIVKSPFNLGSIARFYWARKLVLAGRVGPLVVLDDDEDVTDDFITICTRSYSPTGVSGWWAWVVGEGYYDRTPAEIGGHVDHVGPGGVVCNIELFRDAHFFTGIPLKFWLLDDLWFTYFVKSKGHTLAKLPVDIEFVLPETNQHHVQGEMKHEFFNLLYLK